MVRNFLNAVLYYSIYRIKMLENYFWTLIQKENKIYLLIPFKYWSYIKHSMKEDLM